MHILMALWEGGGTVPVEVGIARRLVDAGHRVTVIADSSMRPAVDAAGAHFRSWVTAPHPVQEVLADWECTNPYALFRRLLDRLVTGPSARYAADVRAVAATEAFDAAVVDVALLGALVGTESLGIPTAVSFPGVYLRPNPGEPPPGLGLSPGHGLMRWRDQALPRAMNRMWDLGLSDLNSTRGALGLPPLAHVWDQVDRAARVLLLTAESFDFPALRPPNVRYVGPVLDDPDWADTPAVDLPPGDEPLVLVGLSGSRIRGGPELLHRVVDGLSLTPFRAVVPTGPHLSTTTATRPGIQVVPAVAHRRVLPHAAAVITHGGHGTVIKALAAGCPVLVLPLGRDQPDNAARVTRLGVGIRLRPNSSPQRIAAAVTELILDPAYTASAAALGQRIRAETDDRRIVDEIESIAPQDN